MGLRIERIDIDHSIQAEKKKSLEGDETIWGLKECQDSTKKRHKKCNRRY